MPDIIIVDDNKDLSALIADRFNKGQMSCIYALDGDAALAKIKECRNAGNAMPLICILDVMMPGLRGVELMRAIRAQTPEIRFMLISAYDAIPEIKEMTGEGIIEIFYKPFKIDELIAKASFVFSNTRRIPIA